MAFRYRSFRVRRLTEKEYWDSYWNDFKLPVEHKKSSGNLYINEILDTLSRHIPSEKELRVLEIGGAPGQYLAYIAREFDCRVTSLDYSSTGCEATRHNFELLGLEAEVIEADLFGEEINRFTSYDVVYSLGFVEHFDDITDVVKRHLRFLKDDGVLIIGFPNFLGVNGWIMKRFDKQTLDRHNLKVMELSMWDIIERNLRLIPLFKGYIGGFEPKMFRMNRKNLINSAIRILLKVCRLFTDRWRLLRKINGRFLSGYVMLVYRKGG
ncbi:MAG: methyltransferase domain-containing protein [candidate division Zixibacteria bacterium]|nr:methyltransferase domain-containing protein [candidate division Zixibacteria bacterium]